MEKSSLTITPVDNVDYEKGRVIDDSKVETKDFEWDAPIRIFDTKTKKETNVIVHGVSLYDHRLILDGVRYHILHMLTK